MSLPAGTVVASSSSSSSSSSSLSLLLSVLWPVLLLGAQACPTQPAVEPPVTPPVAPVGTPTRILPAYLEHNEACDQRRDGDGDGVFEEERHIVLNDALQVIRRTRRIEGRGLSDQVLLRLDVDGEVHDDETYSTGADFVPVSYGNAHAFYEDGRLVREVFEGSDARILLSTRFYSYDGDDLVGIDTASANEAVVVSSSVEQDFVDGALVERRTDNGLDGVDEVARFEVETAADGSSTTTTTREDSAGTHVEVFVFDSFGVMLRFDADDDGDGTPEFIVTADVVDGLLAGYDFDEDGDGDVESRQDYTYDLEAQTLLVTSRTGDVVLGQTDSSYACFSAVVDRGGCEAPFLSSEAFGCARFAFGPALDKARADPAIGVSEHGFIAAAGLASFPLGPIYGAVDVVDVDAVDPVVVEWRDEHGLPAVVALGTPLPGDGSLLALGGIRGGSDGSDIVSIGLDGATTTVGALTIPRHGGQAVQLANGNVVVLGGFTADGAATDGEVRADGGGGGSVFPIDVAPFNATFTRVGDDFALYVGGDDGTVDFIPSARLALLFFGEPAHETNLPEARTDHAAVAVDANTVLIIGGRGPGGIVDSVLSIEVSDVNQVAIVSEGPPLPLPLKAVAAVLLDDGRVLVAGGFSAPDQPSAATFVLDVLDGGVWRAGPPLQIPRGHARAVVLGDGRVAVIGGSLRDGSASSAVELLELAAP